MDSLRVYLVTWNVATQSPEEDVTALLGLSNRSSKDKLPDLYFIGLQEVKSQPQNMLLDAFFDDPWSNTFRNVLAKHKYIKIKTVRLQGLVLSAYCLSHHLTHIRDLQTQFTKTGLGGMWGNKGAVTVRFNIYGCSVCVVNAHLAPHDHMLKERIADYNTIVSSQTFSVGETTQIFLHDYVFWIGDLNFRLADPNVLTGVEIKRLVACGELKSLLDKDQLRQAMALGSAFSEMTEQLPTFPPTYKFSLRNSTYDLKRRPSWTDRVLYFVHKNVYENITLQAEQLSYNSFPQYEQSDHKPVVSEFVIKVFSDYHDRMVEFLPVEDWYLDEMNSVFCRIGDDVKLSPWDWIGLYKEDFSSLDDYLCYVYVTTTPTWVEQNGGQTNQNRNTLKLTFPDSAARLPGRYQVVYVSHNPMSVLGISEPFQVYSPRLQSIDWPQS
ncbi:hypothetical protein ONE63_000403 [Megalurothrips usitatus]|uniref:Inositol polyphosphate-related phosphatase domain-containing protein n=1 Tax=Megalurothrips usitatus TaxID=439358 RepID=A0AAV7Y2B1_9NEOP|nr:hypothetical protein ONE63_000403 [Megalurothrips usitatus]